jgi:hypothetical protein
MRTIRLKPVYLLLSCCFWIISEKQLHSQSGRCDNYHQQISAMNSFFQNVSYTRLFLSGGDSKSDSIWNEGSNREALECMVADSAIEKRSRFLAAELLFIKSDWIPSGRLKTDVAFLYAEALKGNYTEKANHWGLPDDVGMVGKHVLLLGDDAMVAFYPLLSCKTPVHYYGSKVATAGKIYKYRIKDIAATYISSLLNKTFNAERAPVFRDLQIARLKRAVRKSGIIHR